MRKVYIVVFQYFYYMKDPKKMTTEELIELADKIKSGMTDEWIKRREKIKSKPLLVQQY